MKKLFVLVSTGQNVANLPPVLEFAEPGDCCLWIESDLSRRLHWSDGARSVLARCGVRELSAVEVSSINDPAAIVEAVRPAVQQAATEQLTPWLVLNGGSKLVPLGLLQACEGLEPTMLYGDDQPASVLVFRQGLDSPAERQRYANDTLDLPQILAVSGHQIQNSSGPEAAICFWPGPLPEAIAQEPYAEDERYTTQLHADVHASCNPDRFIEGSDLPGYDIVERLADPERLEKWKRALNGMIHARNALTNPHVLKATYQATMNLALHAAAQAKAEGRPQSEAPLGASFERAVARRVHQWLDEHGGCFVRSAWMRVLVAKTDLPHVTTSEFDVLLVLRNGILWHLECKTFRVDKKDLDARVLMLQQSGSQLARMCLCGPLLTDYSQELWFKPLHELSQRVRNRIRLPFLPFTLPGQSPSYTWIDSNDREQTMTVPAFEDSLQHQLKRYCPGDA